MSYAGAVSVSTLPQTSHNNAGNGYKTYKTYAGITDEMMSPLLPLVNTLALVLVGRLPLHVKVDDLKREGEQGLLEAIRDYDISRGVKLRTFAKHRIKGAMIDYLRNIDVVSKGVRRIARKIDEVAAFIQNYSGRAIVPEEIAEYLNMNSDRVVEVMQLMNATRVKPEIRTYEDGTRKKMDRADSVDTSPGPLDLLLQKEEIDEVWGSIGTLSEMEQEVFKMYYLREMKMKKIGLVLGTSESNVSLIHSGAIKKLRKRLRANAGGRHL